MKHFSYDTQGAVCAKAISLDLDENNLVHNVVFTGGCPGNHTGISHLVEGMPADEVIKRLQNIGCGGRPTSCPGELAAMLKEILK